MSEYIEYTLHQEDYENYITESDAKDMIKGFNSHLKNLSIQADEMKNSVASLTAKLDKELARNQDLRKKINEQKNNINVLEENIKGKESHLEELEQRIYSENRSIDPGAMDAIRNFGNIEFDGLDSQKIFNEAFEYLESLVSSNVILSTQKDLLFKKVNDYDRYLKSEITCVVCKEKYIRAKNHDKACSYHSGNLRYFSCRGCGEDAYYDCCSRCKECSKGCKITHHTS